MKRPNSMRHLDDAIRRLCGCAPQDFVRARTVMANAIVASMLPDGVVKGGSALKMRFGEENTRFTTDLDTATATDPAAYAAQLDSRLRSGWEGFSGRVVEKDPASPDGIPEQYVMQPYDVKLDYLGKPWCTVPLEVDLTAARAACRRLFSYRRAQAWPPAIAKQKGWDEMYASLAEGLPVLQDVDEAIRWANEFVARIEDAR